MSSTFAWYADAGLTVPLSRGDLVRGSTAAPVDRIAYFGSPAAGRKLQRESGPGTDPLQVSIVGGGDVPADDVRLALTAPELNSAAGGAPLGIGTTMLSGPMNAVAIFVRIDSGLTAQNNYDGAVLRVAGWLETDQ